MTTRKSVRKTALSTLVAALILTGCGGETPESMVASAKDYLEKKDNKAAVIQLKNALQGNPDLAEARFLLGKAMLESGNPTAADVELRKAADLKYPADQLVPLMARTQLVLGQPQKITNELAKVELTTPESKADLQSTIGQAYLMMGKTAEAQAAFDAAIAAVPGYSQALIGQARIKASNRDLPGALALLDSSLEKNPKLHEAWQLKGVVLAAKGDVKAASEAYRKALEIKPDYLPAHSALISYSVDSGNLDEAARQLDALKKVAPSHPQTSYLQALLLYRQKNFKAAQESIQQHLKFMPDSALGLQLAGAIDYELKSYSTAESNLLKALPKTPELGLARRTLIATYLRSAQPAKAMATLQPVIDKIDQDSNMLALAGEVFMQSGETEKAGDYFAKAAALDPENKAKQTSVALSHLAKGDTETAYRELEKIAAVDTGVTADIALISSQLRMRQFDAALKSIDVLEKKQPENPLAQQLRGTALLGKGDLAGARKGFEQALVKNPAYFPAAASLANLDLSEKNPADAKKRFEDVLAKDAKNMQAMLALAELQAKTEGKPDEVIAQINKAVSAHPTEMAPRLALIAAYLAARDAKKAVAAAQEALAVLPDRPEILDAAGRAQQAAEDFNQALATYGKLANLKPDSPQPHLRMAEIHLAAKNKEASMQSLRKALAVKPDSLEAQRGIMMLELDAGRMAEALAVAKQVQKQRPKEAVGYVLEGDAYAAKKSWNEAAEAFRVGIKQIPATELAVKLHAILLAGGKTAEADKFAEGWVKEHAKDLQFRLYLAESANNRKDYVTASKHYRVLVDAQPNNPAMLNNLAWNLSQSNDPKAIDYAEQAYKLAPEQPAILDTLGTILVDKGDAARGVELLTKASSLASQNSKIRFNLAKALVKTGKKEEAKKELDELAKLGEKFPEQAAVEKLRQSL
ncbi:MAG: PEP-CTERM system TPR-repeat protein PrsT [Propionivibrio sp.]